MADGLRIILDFNLGLTDEGANDLSLTSGDRSALVHL